MSQARRAGLSRPAIAGDQVIRALPGVNICQAVGARRVLFFTDDELKATGSAKIRTADLRALAAQRLRAEGRDLG